MYVQEPSQTIAYVMIKTYSRFIKKLKGRVMSAKCILNYVSHHYAKACFARTTDIVNKLQLYLLDSRDHMGYPTTLKGKTKSMFGSYGINRVNKK